MPKFKIAIREQDDQKTKTGTYNVKIRVTHQGKTRDIGTDYYVTPQQIDPDGTIVDHPSSAIYNIKLRNILNLYETRTMDFGGQVRTMDMKTLLYHLKSVDQLGRNNDFFFLAENLIGSLREAGRISYANSMAYTISEMKSFSGTSFLFSELTSEYLGRFRTYILKEKSKTTANIHYRNMKVIYYKAVDNGQASLDPNPFRQFKIKQEKSSEEKDLEASDIGKIMRADLKLKAQVRARDLFMLSFFLCGLNFKDLLYARQKDIKRGRLVLNRIKTEQPLSIKIIQEAQEIIDRYPGKDLVLNIMEKKKKVVSPGRKSSLIHMDVIHQTNRQLKIIEKALELPIRVTTYTARHSFSSIAFNDVGASEEIIGLALGHASPRKITAGYIKKKYAQVDIMQRGVVDLL